MYLWIYSFIINQSCLEIKKIYIKNLLSLSKIKIIYAYIYFHISILILYKSSSIYILLSSIKFSIIIFLVTI